MDSESNNKHDTGFLFSLNLMVLGGILLLFLIITSNKLLNHYFHLSSIEANLLFFPFGKQATEIFRINSQFELYLNWFAFTLSFIGFVWVMYKLVTTWKL